jgi:transglutaminase-like putative cysteine protease
MFKHMNEAHNMDRNKIASSFFLQILWLGLMLGLGFPVHADDPPVSEAKAENKPKVESPAKWVAPVFFTRLDGSAKIAPGEDQRYLLLETQLNAGENDAFHHFSRQILTIAGVQSGASISVDYHPSYQTLTFHWVNIWRGTNVINRLAPEKIQLIQPERDLDQYLYSGKRSAMLILEDVRVGDIIDYAYSIQGANPVYGGKFSAEVPVQFEQPVEHLVTRVLWPVQRQLYAKNHRCSVTPTFTRTKELVEYKWDFRKVEGVKPEDLLPGWYDPVPWVQLGEFKSWGEVNQWALCLFRHTAPLSPELTQKIAQWQRAGSREDQILAVLRFVQDEVRYFGIEIAANAYQPQAPSVVFDRRFGDCKDKAFLFVTVLRALGIEAYPVLVNTEARGTLEEWQPSAMFDHAITQVRLNGETYWLDPTDCYQRGPLAAHYLPHYALGLVIQPGTTNLTPIPHVNGWPKTTVSEYFILRGKLAPADLKVVTVAEGADAETLRMKFATTPRDQIEKSYLAHYSAVYSGTKQAQPLQFVDDEQHNRIEVTEFYTIDRMWTPSERNKSYYCQFFPYDINDLLKQPVDKARSMPLEVPFPQHRIVRTEVTLPRAWPASTQNKVITDPAFSFRMNSRRSGTSLVVEYEYSSQTNSVPAQRTAEYVQRLNTAAQSLGSTLVWE